jgi:dihydrofolate reductase
MRRLRYSVATSLDGFIAGANGEYDWIVMDPAVDFTAIFKDFDTLLMGRLTFEKARQGPGATMPGMRTVVCSTTLHGRDYPDVTITADATATVSALKAKPGKDLWLFGGGALFRSLLDAGLVDTIEVSFMPILLSKGIPLLPGGQRSPRLRLANCKAMPSGIVGLNYTVDYGAV